MTTLRLVYACHAPLLMDMLTVSSTATGFSASNLLNDKKSLVHRSVGTEVSYKFRWWKRSIQAVVLPATNLTSSAVARVTITNVSETATLFDSDEFQACPGADDVWDGWAGARDVNAFQMGAASKVVLWLPSSIVQGFCTVTLSDPNNPAGFIDCSRILVGSVWEPKHNFSYGAELVVSDSSESRRSEAGDLVIDRGFRFDRLSLKLDNLEPADRAVLRKILAASGTSERVFVSAFPGSADAALEHDHMVYGRLSEAPMSHPFFDTFSAPIEVEGW